MELQKFLYGRNSRKLRGARGLSVMKPLNDEEPFEKAREKGRVLHGAIPSAASTDAAVEPVRRFPAGRKGFVLTFAVMFFFISYLAFLLDYIKFEQQDYFVFENIPYIIDDIVSDLDVMIRNNSKIIDIHVENGSIYIKDVMGKEKSVSELSEPKKYDVFLKYTPRSSYYGIEASVDVQPFLNQPKAQIYSAGNYRIYLDYDHSTEQG